MVAAVDLLQSLLILEGRCNPCSHYTQKKRDKYNFKILVERGAYFAAIIS